MTRHQAYRKLAALFKHLQPRRYVFDMVLDPDEAWPRKPRAYELRVSRYQPARPDQRRTVHIYIPLVSSPMLYFTGETWAEVVRKAAAYHAEKCMPLDEEDE